MLRHLFYETLRRILGVWLRRRFRMRVVTCDPWPIRPPYLLLANHVNFWDPFLVGVSVPQEVHFVAADSNFRTRLMRNLLSLVRAVAKSKARTDMESVHEMRRIIRNGGVVALFPEGQRTWDGVSRPILAGTAKLVRMLDVPVVCPVLRGAYLSTPRWSPFKRRGLLEVDLQVILNRGEAGTLAVGDIHAKIEAALSHDEDAWERERDVTFLGRRRAEFVEQAYFWCPSCGAYGSVDSSGNAFSCGSCGAGARVTTRGRLTGVDDNYPVATFREWNVAQLAALRSRAADIVAGSSREVIAWIDDATLRTGHRSRPMSKVGRGRILLTATALIVEQEQGKLIRFPVASLTGVTVQFAQDLEFYHARRLYVIRPTTPRASAYWLEQAILLLNHHAGAVSSHS